MSQVAIMQRVRRTSGRFDPIVFPKYGQLTPAERLFLRTCCYFPPRPHRVRTPEFVTDTPKYEAILARGFGPEVWAWITGRDVLDFGCGEGGITLALAARGAGHVTGLDILPDFAFAEAEAARRGAPITFVDAPSTTLPAAGFDVVLSHDSFEHFEEPEAILAEMVRLTRPGGRILIKFGPTWLNPYGRHMGGTIRKDRPWVHLLVSERTIMHVHSVYHNDPVLSETYRQLPGGLNKMTVGRFRRIIAQQPGITLESFRVSTLHSLPVAGVPVLGELLSASVRAICVRSA